METTAEKTPTSTIIGFIESIGLTIKFVTGIQGTFLPGLRIEKGEILVDENQSFYPGDLLHEAGHLAVIPAAERPGLSNENIATREQYAAEEMMSIAWSYAACCYLELDARVVFHDNGYKNGGSEIAADFSNGRYFGVPMLQWVGLTTDPASKNIAPGAVLYPKMIRWLRE
jgi:hypothetical protein